MSLSWRVVVCAVVTLAVVWVLLAAPTESEPVPQKYQISASAGNQVWRVDTQTGEVVSCSLTSAPAKSAVTCHGKKGPLP
jgi:hypothetical protein